VCYCVQIIASECIGDPLEGRAPRGAGWGTSGSQDDNPIRNAVLKTIRQGVVGLDPVPSIGRRRFVLALPKIRIHGTA